MRRPTSKRDLTRFDQRQHIRIRVPQRLELAVRQEAGSCMARRAAKACGPGKPRVACPGEAAARRRTAVAALPPDRVAQDLDLVVAAELAQWLVPPSAR
ncbi:hypothetical protein V6582_17310 [Agrobacterium vitis]|uniref:hypothetical protein n=1 Tax=Agrobacterium vitis TaxID=373 RepID=UPI0012E908FA|nr:hypothetical protein [Agrobacterium vitis]MVA25657.1 hypothetical protein [Agrobacterium vitis]